MEQRNILAQEQFTTNKALLDIYYKNYYISVSPRIARQLKTEELLEKFQNWMDTEHSTQFPLQK